MIADKRMFSYQLTTRGHRDWQGSDADSDDSDFMISGIFSACLSQ